MNQYPTLSIIVPVYNAEAYLEQCIQSVLDQADRTVELILVDDGSTDVSLQICRSWEHDSRVKILATENHGVSHARNLGLDHAGGEWIMFLDSDDYLLANSLERLLALAAPDVHQIAAAYTTGQEAPVTVLHDRVSAASLIRMSLDSINHQLLPEFYEVKPMSLPACWAKLYRSRIIRENGIRFHEDLHLSEDTLFNLDYLACIETVVLSNLPVLHYRENTSSVTRVFSASHLENRFRFFRILEERWGQDAAVHILSLLFCEICKIERHANRSSRKQLEQAITVFLSENPELLLSCKSLSLSSGRWQRLAYSLAAHCFRRKLHRVGFTLLRAYAAIKSS